MGWGLTLGTWDQGRAGESNGEKGGTTEIEQKNNKKLKLKK